MRAEPETTERERAALIDALRRESVSGIHLEIGTAAGGTLKELMAVYPPSKRPPFVVVDPLTYFPGQKEAISENLSSSGIDPSSVEFRVTTSGEAFKVAKAAEERFSFIFIDAVHLADYVMEDLQWTTLLTVGGLVALHDHCAKYPGVLWAVRHFLRFNRNYKIVAEAESLIVLKKISPSMRREVGFYDKLASGVVAIPIHWGRMWEKKRRPSVPSPV